MSPPLVRALLWSAVIGIAATPQDPPKPSQEEVIKELEAKFATAGPLAADVNIYLQAPQGESEVRSRGSLYLAIADRHLYLRMTNRKGGKDLPESFTYGDQSGLKMWGGGEKPVMTDYERILGPLKTSMDASVAQLNAILGRPPNSESGPRSLVLGNPAIVLTLEEERDNASLRFALGSTPGKGDTSWFREIRQEAGGTYRLVEDGVEFDPPSQGRVIIVDRATGFVRALRLRLKSGESWLLEMSGIRKAAERPRPSFPDRFTVPIPGVKSAIRMLFTGAYAMCHWTVAAILNDLDREGILRKAPDLRLHCRGLLERICWTTSDCFVALAADRTVESLIAKGNSLDELEAEVDGFSTVLAKEFKSVEAERADMLEWVVKQAHERLLTFVQESEKAGPGCKAELEKVIRESLKDPKDPRFVPAAPDPKEAFRRALKRAREAK